MKKEISKLDSVKKMLPTDDTLYDLAEIFKVFADPTRAKIMSCLRIGDLNVGEIASACDMSTSAVSHQLRILRNAKLVKATKEGKEVRYALDDDHVEEIIECGLSHLIEAQERR